MNKIPFCERYQALRDSIRPALLHTRHGTDGKVLEQHTPTSSTTVVRIRAAVRRAQP